MRVEVGPVASDSVIMWLAYARTILAQVLTQPRAFGVRLSEDQITAFESYLDEWDLIANSGTVFRWVTDADPDKVRELADTWMVLTDGLAVQAAKRGHELLPQEGRPFNDALVVAVLEALAAEGRA